MSASLFGSWLKAAASLRTKMDSYWWNVAVAGAHLRSTRQTERRRRVVHPHRGATRHWDTSGWDGVTDGWRHWRSMVGSVARARRRGFSTCHLCRCVEFVQLTAVQSRSFRLIYRVNFEFRGESVHVWASACMTDGSVLSVLTEFVGSAMRWTIPTAHMRLWHNFNRLLTLATAIETVVLIFEFNIKPHHRRSNTV